MLNQIILVGRLTNEPTMEELENGKKKTIITLAIPRTYKNVNGEYETDFIDCVLWSQIAESTTEYCRKGDLVGVKGRLQTRFIDISEEEKHKVMEVVTEKVTFLSSGKGEEI